MQILTYMEGCLADFPLAFHEKYKMKSWYCCPVCSGLPLQAAGILRVAVAALAQLELRSPGLRLLRWTGRAENHRTQSADCSHMIPCKQRTPGHCQSSHQLQKFKRKTYISPTAIWIHNFKKYCNQIWDWCLCHVTCNSAAFYPGLVFFPLPQYSNSLPVLLPYPLKWSQ